MVASQQAGLATPPSKIENKRSVTASESTSSSAVAWVGWRIRRSRHLRASVRGDNEVGEKGSQTGSSRSDDLIVPNVSWAFLDTFCFLSLASWTMSTVLSRSLLMSVARPWERSCWMRCADVVAASSVVTTDKMAYPEMRSVSSARDLNRLPPSLWLRNCCRKSLCLILLASSSSAPLRRDEGLADGEPTLSRISSISSAKRLLAPACLSSWMLRTAPVLAVSSSSSR